MADNALFPTDSSPRPRVLAGHLLSGPPSYRLPAEERLPLLRRRYLWSNPSAPVEVLSAALLTKPSFEDLLALVSVVGLQPLDAACLRLTMDAGWPSFRTMESARRMQLNLHAGVDRDSVVAGAPMPSIGAHMFERLEPHWRSDFTAFLEDPLAAGLGRNSKGKVFRIWNGGGDALRVTARETDNRSYDESLAEAVVWQPLLRLDRINDETARILESLTRTPAVRPFVLAGGTALALQLAHRESFDIDLMFPKADGETLPGDAIEHLIRQLQGSGHQVERRQNVAAEQDFAIDGLRLTDYQVDLEVDGIKLQIWRPHDDVESAHEVHHRLGHLAVASLDELFQMKARLPASTLRGRDAFDLYVLMTGLDYDLDDFAQAFRDEGLERSLPIALERLAGMKLLPQDPWVQVKGAPAPKAEDLAAFFELQLNQYQQQLAEATLGNDPSM